MEPGVNQVTVTFNVYFRAHVVICSRPRFRVAGIASPLLRQILHRLRMFKRGPANCAVLLNLNDISISNIDQLSWMVYDELEPRLWTIDATEVT
ncbi:hypothetical protein BTUL_0044g00460 [Botrytis tulipae]|uniref:Uncharacterized protein n=1 Tax=Botrytis tulipae TaxID=87230 RepID=A0A4Z1F1Y8_9HELO|nr:hypothetical protein BTUL_0044g00460 [Botrytis tulipae]